MRQKLDPSTIVRTSDFTGFEGLRVLIREWPRNGGFDTGRKGSPCFQLGYRPVEEHGHTVLRFGEAPELDIKMTRVSAIVPPAKPFEVNYCDADGKIATFEIESRFMADVIGRASVAIANPRPCVAPVIIATVDRFLKKNHRSC